MRVATDVTIELLREVLRNLSACELDEVAENYHKATPILDDNIEKLKANIAALSCHIPCYSFIPSFQYLAQSSRSGLDLMRLV